MELRVSIKILESYFLYSPAGGRRRPEPNRSLGKT